jgi:hypothetical protein
MKKVIALVASLSFCAALSANNVKVSRWDEAKAKSVEVYGKVKETIKNNKYAKYSLIGTGAVAGAGAVWYGYSKFKK